MFTVQGKYNSAIVFANSVDDTTMSQIIGMCNLESLKNANIVIMPDCHAGKGCTIGTTMTVVDSVIPNMVGVDIGCGIYAHKFYCDAIDLVKFDKMLQALVPSGFDVHEDMQIPNETFKSLVDGLHAELSNGEISRAKLSVGTLGGGNHFIEIGKSVDEPNVYYLFIHSGSRNFGKLVADYHQNIAIKRHGYIDINAIISQLKADGKEYMIQQKLAEAKEHYVPDEVAFLRGSDMDNYLADMHIGMAYASLNRRTMFWLIQENILRKLYGYEELLRFDTIHNYIGADKILRKGAISASEGELVSIPMNMRDGTLICIGKGNDSWNQSAPHGAGRILSRGQAKKSVSMDDYVESMKGIYSTSVQTSTIDESPMAYKPMEEIVGVIGDTVEIVEQVKPVYNFKAH